MELTQGLAVLAQAANASGLASHGAEVIRNGSHLMCKLPDGIVGRIGRRGSEDSARREVNVSRWLMAQQFPAVRVAEGLRQPVIIDGYPVTWWEFLANHRPATPKELGITLRSVHRLPSPIELDIPAFDPFLKIDQRIKNAKTLPSNDLGWLSKKLDELEQEYSQIEPLGPFKLIHGDAWQGNVAVSTDGCPVLLDLESVSLGPPEWDLIPIATDFSDFARISPMQYSEFVEAYGGFDVTSWPPFRYLVDIQELKWISFALALADESTLAEREVRHRLACFRYNLPRPWKWTAL